MRYACMEDGFTATAETIQHRIQDCLEAIDAAERTKREAEEKIREAKMHISGNEQLLEDAKYVRDNMPHLLKTLEGRVTVPCTDGRAEKYGMQQDTAKTVPELAAGTTFELLSAQGLVCTIRNLGTKIVYGREQHVVNLVYDPPYKTSTHAGTWSVRENNEACHDRRIGFTLRVCVCDAKRARNADGVRAKIVYSFGQMRLV